MISSSQNVLTYLDKNGKHIVMSCKLKKKHISLTGFLLISLVQL